MLSTAQITGAAELMSAYMSGGFLVDFVAVMAANIGLSGGNAVVIALAARSLAREKRVQVIVIGTIVSIFMRIALTGFAPAFLIIPCVNLCAGLLILFIALKLLLDKNPEDDEKQTSGGTLKAVIVIFLANLAMSLDNIHTVAEAAKSNAALLFLGLAVSIPIVAFGGGIMSRLMGRSPVFAFACSAILGKIAAEMVLGDPLIVRLVHAPGPVMRYGTEVVAALGVVAAGLVLIRLRDIRHPPIHATSSGPFHVAGWDIR